MPRQKSFYPLIIIVKFFLVLFLVIVRFVTATICDRTRNLKSGKKKGLSSCSAWNKGSNPSRTTLEDFYIWHALRASLIITSLNERTKARLPGNGPRGTFAAYLEWVLVNNVSAFTICPAEDDITCPNLDPEPSQPPPTHCTADRESEPTSMQESDKRT